MRVPVVFEPAHAFYGQLLQLEPGAPPVMEVPLVQASGPLFARPRTQISIRECNLGCLVRELFFRARRLRRKDPRESRRRWSHQYQTFPTYNEIVGVRVRWRPFTTETDHGRGSHRPLIHFFSQLLGRPRLGVGTGLPPGGPQRAATHRAPLDTKGDLVA